MTPQQLLAKLAALVPPPRAHLVRYHGVFANRHRLRSDVAPKPPMPLTTVPHQLVLLRPDGRPAWVARELGNVDADLGRGVPRHRKRSWARLLARVFHTDVTACPCGGRLRPLGAVLTPEDIALRLHGARAPPRVSPPGQLTLLPD